MVEECPHSEPYAIEPSNGAIRAYGKEQYVTADVEVAKDVEVEKVNTFECLIIKLCSILCTGRNPTM